MYEQESLYAQHAYGKLSKVRFSTSPGTFSDKNILFATGTWDELKSNTLTIWSLEEASISLDNSFPSFNNKIVAKTSHKGDVTDMQFSGSILFTSSSEGDFNAFKCIQSEREVEADLDYAIEPQIYYNYTLQTIITHRLHRFSESENASATGIAIRPNSESDPEIVSVGEDDGTIGVTNLNSSPMEGFRDQGMARENVVSHKYSYEYSDLAINSIDYHPLAKMLIGGGDGQNLFSMRLDR
ncbi:2468_t:CDS:2 [Acaulospora colombiana]|uniref:2468_t:CDS:1 n=1 Tax=Acaulospora colombiana TaxID=27376 RepID=A0ACA9L0X1_9GLOM|nr:2468_t:CDS:2 [Acaulospora colombiana]